VRRSPASHGTVPDSRWVCRLRPFPSLDNIVTAQCVLVALAVSLKMHREDFLQQRVQLLLQRPSVS
jgi:hypothetical protein